MSIIIKSDPEIELMSRAGKIVAEILKKLKSEVRPGITTRELDEIAAREVVKLGANLPLKDTGVTRQIFVYR